MAFVDGSLAKSAMDSSYYKAWERYNTMLIGWIMTSLERSVAKRVMYYSTSRDIWLNLEERFGQSCSTKLYHIQQDLAALTQGGTSIAEYYTKAIPLCDELDNINPLLTCSCNGCTYDIAKRNSKQLQNQRTINFLMHLDDHFFQIRSNILTGPALRVLSKGYRPGPHFINQKICVVGGLKASISKRPKIKFQAEKI